MPIKEAVLVFFVYFLGSANARVDLYCPWPGTNICGYPRWRWETKCSDGVCEVFRTFYCDPGDCLTSSGDCKKPCLDGVCRETCGSCSFSSQCGPEECCTSSGNCKEPCSDGVCSETCSCSSNSQCGPGECCDSKGECTTDCVIIHTATPQASTLIIAFTGGVILGFVIVIVLFWSDVAFFCRRHNPGTVVVGVRAAGYQQHEHTQTIQQSPRKDTTLLDRLSLHNIIHCHTLIHSCPPPLSPSLRLKDQGPSLIPLLKLKDQPHTLPFRIKGQPHTLPTGSRTSPYPPPGL